jgi:protein arginine N-methyltransferase 1
LTAQRQDNIHAFICYFDSTFNACHKPVVFSTGPHAPYTHWKQTVFYLKNPIAAGLGDVIEGEIDLKPNAKNPRDLDVLITYEMKGEVESVKEEMAYRMC